MDAVLSGSPLTVLSEEHGPRLTGSAALQEANEWTRDEFARLGLEAHLHEWGTVPVRFDRGPSHARVLAPVCCGSVVASVTRSPPSGVSSKLDARQR